MSDINIESETSLNKSDDDSTDAKESKKCSRIIYRNKYERNDPESKNWWATLFKILEEDAKIPPDKQKALLEEVFPIRLLYKVLSKLSTQSRKFQGNIPEIPKKYEPKVTQIQRVPTITRTKTDKRCSEKSYEDMKVLKSPNMFENIFEPVTRPEAIKSKMYIDFFKRKPSRAAVWRTLPPLSLDEMNLNQKAEAITEKIATDFIEWLRDLGGDEELSLSVPAVIEMFEIGFQTNSATSLKVDVKEIASVPQKVAEARNLPLKAQRAFLHGEIMKDLKASKKKTTYAAFGRRLPSDMQVRPPAENYFKKWLSCDKVPERLASMATVWQGITHLRSTRAYCEFLIERPEIKPPKYLLDCGMLNLKNLRENKSTEFSELSLPNLFSE
ncbi:uncharacterized protein LOC143192976 [Rhynchophorus ferrugineus]|uniref:uncharacterized protein LOC143192976 n=1 Tax=Rhynchophorus ferrugineus TaxID=354439 RepID=UPI003FCEE11D